MDGPPTILMVDDEDGSRDRIAVLLRHEGYSVKTFADGFAALHALQNGLRPCIILDLDMSGMDGYEFRHAQIADPELARIPVIVFSIAADMAQRVWHHRGGRLCAEAERLVTKPSDFVTLMASIGRFCEK